MSSQASVSLALEPNDSHRLAVLCGPFDQNLRHIEQRLGIHIRNRGNRFHVTGAPDQVRAGRLLIDTLYRETGKPQVASGGLSPNDIHLYLQESGVEAMLEDDDSRQPGAADPGVVPVVDGAAEAPGTAEAAEATDPDADDLPLIRTRKKMIKPRGPNQLRYVRAILDNDINFGIGPAGTGKTYLAVACAVAALEAEAVGRLLLVRPAVEAGEKLGFLPGDLSQKIDPYLRPLYDALYEMMGFERVHKLIERNVIEVAPLAYMRGRTLNNSWIILDESQNTTVEQMKMFLTRIGFGSTAVITGDITQVDLPRGTRSGLLHVMDVLDGVPGISFTRFRSKDVVRHPLVQRIVEAYDAHERREGGQQAGDGAG